MNVALAFVNVIMSAVIGLGCVYVAFTFVDRTVMRSKVATNLLLVSLFVAAVSCALNVTAATKSVIAGSTPIDRAREAADLELQMVSARTAPGPRRLVRDQREKAFGEASAAVGSEVLLNVAIAGILGWSIYFHQSHVIPMMRARKKAERQRETTP